MYMYLYITYIHIIPASSPTLCEQCLFWAVWIPRAMKQNLASVRSDMVASTTTSPELETHTGCIPYVVRDPGRLCIP